MINLYLTLFYQMDSKYSHGLFLVFKIQIL